MRKADEPFYSFLISLSSHFPYVDSTGNYDLREQLDVGQWQGTFIGNFLQSVHFADEAIGVLIEELKAAGLWDNLLLSSMAITMLSLLISVISWRSCSMVKMILINWNGKRNRR